MFEEDFVLIIINYAGKLVCNNDKKSAIMSEC